MRSFIIKSALAAILVSTSLAGAYARSGHGDHEPGPGASSSESGDGSDNSYFDHMTMGPAGVPSASPPVEVAPMTAEAIVRHPEFHKRIARIDHELGVANRRMTADRERGTLTTAEYNALRGRSDTIRMSAEQVAESHGGALPTASYDTLQHRIAMLDRTIHRDATT